MSTQANRLVMSGAVASDAALTSGLAGGGKTFNVTGWKSISDSANDYNVSSDNPASSATANNVQTSQQIAARLDRNAVFGSADLAAHLAGADPMASAASELGNYQSTQRTKTLINILTGTFAAASMSAARNDIAIADGAAATTANLISNDSIIDTLAPFDDMQGLGNILFVHGDVYRALQKNNLITFEASSAQNIGFGTYLGLTLVVDSACPKVAGGTSGFKYTSYIMKPGAVGFGAGMPRIPVEVERRSREGNGGGVEYLTVRDAYAYHPYGMKWVGTPSGSTPSNSELAVGTNWLRVYAQKNVGLSALITNG